MELHEQRGDVTFWAGCRPGAPPRSGSSEEVTHTETHTHTLMVCVVDDHSNEIKTLCGFKMVKYKLFII